MFLKRHRADTPKQNAPQSAPRSPDGWELTDEDTAFAPNPYVDVLSTRKFAKTAMPDVHEYLVADYKPVTGKYRLRQCTSVGTGMALSALFDDAGHGSMTTTPLGKSVTLADNACLMVVLNKMSLFEFGMDTDGDHPTRVAVEGTQTPDGSEHFIDVAHGVGVIFDSMGRPSITRNGMPLRDGEYPEKELAIAAQFWEDRRNDEKKMPVIIRATKLLSISQSAWGSEDGSATGSLRHIQALAKVERRLSDVITSLTESNDISDLKDGKHLPKYYLSKQAENKYFSNEGLLKTVENAYASMTDYPEIQSALDDAITGYAVVTAAACTYVMRNDPEYLHYRPNYTEGSNDQKLLQDRRKFFDKALWDLEILFKSSQSIDEQKRQDIGRYIMQDRSWQELRGDVEGLVTSVTSIRDAVRAQYAKVMDDMQPQKNRAQVPAVQHNCAVAPS